MLTIEKITAAAKELPVEFSIDQLMDKLILLEKIEEALDQAERGETYTTEEAQQLLKQWAK
jgi:predicted transcriptional regulator